jgi:hypothetical protein
MIKLTLHTLWFTSLLFLVSCEDNIEDENDLDSAPSTPKNEQLDSSILTRKQESKSTDSIKINTSVLTVPNKQHLNCLKLDDFNSVVSYIENIGKPIPPLELRSDDKDSLSKQMATGTKVIQLYYHQYNKQIIIIENNKDIYMPAYTVSNKNKELVFSAWASLFEGEIQILERKDHWCELVTMILAKE